MAKHLLVFKPSQFWAWSGGALGIIADDLEQARQVVGDRNRGIAEREAAAAERGDKFYWDGLLPIREPLVMFDHTESQGCETVEPKSGEI
jgi:hypothetical protein